MIDVGVGYRCDFPGCDALSGASLDEMKAIGWHIDPPPPLYQPHPQELYDWCPEHVPPF